MVEQANIRLPYVRERQLAKEGIKKVGVALFIVDLGTKNIWVINEAKPKPSTKRTVDTISIPLETRKLGERIANNVKGGLAEFRNLYEGEELVWVDNASYKGRYSLVEGVAADVVVLGLRNRTNSRVPEIVESDEVRPVGWMSLDQLMVQPNLREGVLNFLNLAKKQNWLDQFIASVNENRLNQRTITNNKDFVKDISERDEKRDYGEE